MALKGVRVIELAGLAPAPFCGMILADFGASVIRVDKLPVTYMDVDCLGNGKRSLLLNLKSSDGVGVLKKLAKNADIIIDPFRPGVLEKLGLGPDTMLKENKRLIYARLSGYGQSGPMSQRAGHDINYVAQSGMLSVVGVGEIPSPPVNFAADFAGGGLLCALGIVMALFERSQSGLGQVIDTNMTSGVAYAGSWLFRSKIIPFLWTGPRGTNILDGGSHYYCCYETKDGKFMAVGALEPQFYDLFMQGLGLNADQLPQLVEDVTEAKNKIGNIFKKHTQQHWIDVFKDTDACVTPVLEIGEVAASNKENFIPIGKNSYAPKPSPGLSRTPGESQSTKPNIDLGEHTLEILREAGFQSTEIDQMIKKGVVASKSKL